MGPCPFVESIIRDKASQNKNTRLDFKRALEELGLDINSKNEKIVSYKKNSQHKKDRLVEINSLRIQRNELLHDIIR